MLFLATDRCGGDNSSSNGKGIENAKKKNGISSLKKLGSALRVRVVSIKG